MELLPVSNRSDGSVDADRATARKCSVVTAICGAAGISLVGTAEGLAAELPAVDSQALSDEPVDGETTTGHQCSANRPVLEGEEKRAETAYLRMHPAGFALGASHPGEDR
jgi:hypothetical protein